MCPRPSRSELERLKELEDSLIEEGLSRHGAHKQIADLEGVDDSSVYRWLTPGQMEQQAKYARVYRQRPEVKEARRRWQREYGRFVYHLDEHVAAVTGENDVTLQELSVLLMTRYRFEIHPATLEKYLNALAEKHGLPPLQEGPPGVFRINRRYYTPCE